MDPKRKGYPKLMAAARAQKRMWARAKLMAVELEYSGPTELIEEALAYFAEYMRELCERIG